MLLTPLIKWALGGTLFLSLMLGGALMLEKRQNGKLRQQIERCTEARKADRAAYEKAQAEAKANNLAHVRKVESEQRAKTDEISRSYQSDLARLRALGLRGKDPAAPGSTSPAGSSAIPPTAEGVDGQDLCVPSERLLRAQEIELGRNALIDWINEQLKVPLNPS